MLHAFLMVPYLITYFLIFFFVRYVILWCSLSWSENILVAHPNIGSIHNCLFEWMSILILPSVDHPSILSLSYVF